jgi:uncharacterized membrane protein
VSPNNPHTRFASWSTDGPQWLFKRNCSLSPAQTLQCVVGLVLLSSVVAGFFWSMGAVWVLPFTVAELCAVSAAFAWYARHATDHERIRLQPGRLLLEWESGGKQQQLSFDRSQVQVQAPDRPGGLIVVAGQGHRMAFGRFVRSDLRAALALEIRRAVRGV